MPALPVALVADDSTTIRTLVARILTRAGFSVIEAADGLDALTRLLLDRPAVAVLDHDMPGCTGLEVLRRAKGHPATADIPILILTATEDRQAPAQALDHGAEDYVRKPCDPAELVARVRKVLATRTLLRDLENRSTTDPLTGLLNRRGMTAELDAIVGDGGRLGLLVVDIDHFKAVNDSHGHAVGDLVLQVVAERLAAAARPASTARWGGEEFLVAGPLDDDGALVPRAERLRAAVAHEAVRIDLGPGMLSLDVTVSIGGAVGEPGSDLDRLVAAADAALYEAKAGGRNRAIVALGVHDGAG